MVRSRKGSRIWHDGLLRMRYAPHLTIALILTLLLDYWTLHLAAHLLSSLDPRAFIALADKIDISVLFVGF
jgi:hypothetical protein